MRTQTLFDFFQKVCYNRYEVEAKAEAQLGVVCGKLAISTKFFTHKQKERYSSLSSFFYHALFVAVATCRTPAS